MVGKSGRRGNRPKPRASAPGLVARQIATRLAGAVIARGNTLDDGLTAVEASAEWRGLDGRDRSFARLLAMTHLRRRGQICDVLRRFLRKPLAAEARAASLILEQGVAQLLFLETPPHAAIDLAVRQCQAARNGVRFSGLVNAVLRAVAREGATIVAQQNAGRLNTPDWLMARWRAAYGDEVADEIARAHLDEPALDISVTGDTEGWARRLGAEVLPTGALRLLKAGRVEELPGYDEGGWWVQDFAASLPARLLGGVRGREVADLCAAPGGKTAQLAAAGAKVTAVDVSAKRLARLQENLSRLGLVAELVESDIRHWRPGGRFDCVLLDAPCSATGTIRRHPDVPLLRQPADLEPLIRVQDDLLESAAALLRPGGVLVYCVCSLEVAEGPDRISAFLSRHDEMSLQTVSAHEVGGLAHLIARDGSLRTLPCHDAGQGSQAKGMDGFYAARLRKAATGDGRKPGP